MTFVRAIWADLREKRLWPVALVLAIALVAVPVALSRSGGGTPAVPPLPAAPVAADAQAPTQLVAVDAKAASAPPSGRPHDPFRSGHAVPVAPAASAAPSGAKAAGGGGGGGGGSTAGSSSSKQTTASAPSSGKHAAKPASPSKPKASAAPARSVPAPQPAPSSGYPAGYEVDVHWGPVGGHTKRLRDLVRLARLTPSGQPPVTFVGVRNNGLTALFLLAHGVHPSGDGTCYPSKDLCQLLGMRSGNWNMLSVTKADGSIASYALAVNRVVPRHAASLSAARRLRAAVSKAGRAALVEVVRAGRTYVTEFSYSRDAGVLIRTDHRRHPGTTTVAGASVPAPAAAPVGE